MHVPSQSLNNLEGLRNHAVTVKIAVKVPIFSQKNELAKKKKVSLVY